MHATATSLALGDPGLILDRHTIRRSTGVPTVSVMVGPTVAGRRAWRRWATASGRSVVVANENFFPTSEWVRSVALQLDLPAMAVQSLARRANRDPDEFLVEWRAKTAADRERFWSILAPDPDDNLLGTIATLAIDEGPRSKVAAPLCKLGGQVIPVIVRLAPASSWPTVLFVAESIEDFSAVGPLAAEWALRLPAVPTAVAVPMDVWDQFLTSSPESRTKAVLREGGIAIPVLDRATVEQTLADAGAVGSAVGAIADSGADAALVETALAAARATATPPTSPAEDDRARSAAEHFLFQFLDSLPETAGRFELNAALAFRFGPRPAEVDLLCRAPRIAIELDGYFHFLQPDGYRRDRTKDWELQRRGFVVLRFLAQDVIPQLEMIRDRILDAFTDTPPGARP